MTDLLNIIVSSDKRRNLLLLLKDRPHSWDEIKVQLKVTATGMLPQIRILENEGLVVREGKMYSLTDTGRLLVHHLEPFDQAIRVIGGQKRFFREHDLTALPDEFFLRLHEFKDPRIVEASIEESFEPHTHFLETILGSARVAGISPIVHPIYPRFFLSLAAQGHDVGLILTKNAYDKIKREYSEMLLRGLQYKNARLSICDSNLKFAYIVTDNHISMGLFLKNGIFDSKRDLVSTEPSAIRWGEDLFRHYQNLSRPVNKEGKY